MNTSSKVQICAAIALSACAPVASALPPGFTDEALPPMQTGTVVGVAFAPTGLGFFWEQGGRVFTFENGIRSLQPVLDIQEEIGHWADYGMLGFALDPNFATNGYIYVMYVVDYYYLTRFGLPGYDPFANTIRHDTMGRITRYTCTYTSVTGWRADPASRHILVGETMSTGIPICSTSHGVGSLVFGTDGTLMASCGDAASVTIADDGGPHPGSTYTALQDGIMLPKEDVGAFRAQLIDSLDGKILRINPATGDGIPSNPFFDPAFPRAPRSRVFCLGVRNPFRMTLKPGSGSTDPSLANPGTFAFGDVGWYTYDEVNFFDSPGQNFGWPLYEGLTPTVQYSLLSVPNLDAPNPAASGTCPPYFNFSDLTVQATLNTPVWANPCNGAPITTEPTFVHHRPAMDWGRTGTMRTPTFNPDGTASECFLGTCIPGPTDTGSCSIGGVWYNDNRFPAPYRNTYFHGDYLGGWIMNFVLDSQNRITEVRPFSNTVGQIVSMAVHPLDGSLYYVTHWHSEFAGIRRISAAANGAPTVTISATPTFGASPLNVQLSSAGTFDPDHDEIFYAWDFGDGSPISTVANPTHTFTAPSAAPAAFTISLTVTDEFNHATTRTLIVSPNNTPPTVNVSLPVDGSRYAIDEPILLQLLASAQDQETPASLTTSWQVFLHHNEHQHSDPPLPGDQHNIVLDPYNCNGVDYYSYELRYTATDPQGLTTSQSAFIFPDCCNGDYNGDTVVDFFDYLDFVDDFSGQDPAADFNDDGVIDFFDYLDFVDAFSSGC